MGAVTALGDHFKAQGRLLDASRVYFGIAVFYGASALIGNPKSNTFLKKTIEIISSTSSSSVDAAKLEIKARYAFR